MASAARTDTAAGVYQRDAIREPFDEAELPGVDSSPQVETASHFLLKYGRLPMLGIDSSPPWAYSQWLLFYLQGVEMSPIGSGRWDHYFRTMQAGHLLDEPIPQIEFNAYQNEDTEAHKAMNGWLDILFNEIGSTSAFGTLLDWFSWGLGLTKEEPRITEKTNEKLYREVNLEPLIKFPRDYWGDLYQETKGKRWNNTGFYVTPHQVVEFMARMVFHDVKTVDGKDPRTQSVQEPCCGTGRMLLHASNYSYCLYGQDIDRICVAATKINGALYAPWLTWPFPEAILNGVDGWSGAVEEAKTLMTEEPETVIVVDDLDRQSSLF